jgi:hypothetical protein
MGRDSSADKGIERLHLEGPKGFFVQECNSFIAKELEGR